MICSKTPSPHSELVMAVMDPKSPERNADDLVFFPIRRAANGSLRLKDVEFRGVDSMVNACQRGDLDRQISVKLKLPEFDDETV